MTTLADFIDRERPRILEAWQEHARGLSGQCTELVLKDHIEQLLDAVVADMRRPQSATQQTEKSEGRGAEGPLELVTNIHTRTRGEHGFRLPQIVSEYRALRASILSLWEDEGGGGIEGIGRFNETIDQVIVAAVEHYTTLTAHYQDQSLGILGHDLRNPLNSVIAGASLLANDALDAQQRHDIARRVVASGKRMNRMIADLLDLTRTRFGDAIPITRAPLDLGSLGEQIVAEHISQHPAGVRFVRSGDLHGEWDADRIAQVISNLVRNAIDHGTTDQPVSVTAEGRRDDVLIEVHNSGSPIPEDARRTIFDPMVRHDTTSKHAGLGLGLYIAWQLVEAHEGDIHVESTAEAGTRFIVRLPRHERAAKQAHPS